MAIYAFNPNTVPVGVNPIGNGFTQRMSAPNTSAIVSATTPVGNRAWGYTAISHIPIVSSMDAVPSDTSTCEVLVLARSAGATGGVDDLAELGAVTRMGGAVGALTGHLRGLRRSYSAIQRKWNGDGAGGTSELLTHDLNYVNNSWYWIKMQSNGTTHRARYWLNGTAEPTTWVQSVTDSDYLAGGCGFGGFHNPLYGTLQVAWFSVGTGTDVAPLPPGMDPKTNLVAHWKLDETSGTSAADSAGSNTATLTDVSWVTGEIDNAASFNGTSSRGHAPHHSTLQIADELTLAIWFYPTAVGQNNDSVLVGKGEDSGHAYSLRWASDRTIRHDLSSVDMLSLLNPSAQLPLNAWSHVAVTWNRLASGNNNIMYHNGVNIGSTSFTQALNSTRNTAESFVFGSPLTENSRADRRFQGYLDDIRVYNRALTPNEVSRLATYHQTSGVAITPYVVNYLNMLRG